MLGLLESGSRQFTQNCYINRNFCGSDSSHEFHLPNIRRKYDSFSKSPIGRCYSEEQRARFCSIFIPASRGSWQTNSQLSVASHLSVVPCGVCRYFVGSEMRIWKKKGIKPYPVSPVPMSEMPLWRGLWLVVCCMGNPSAAPSSTSADLW